MSPGTRCPYRVDATRWDTVRDDLDAYGCALTGSLLTPGEAAGIAALHQDDSRFRSTIDMGRVHPRTRLPRRGLTRRAPGGTGPRGRARRCPAGGRAWIWAAARVAWWAAPHE